MKSSNSSLSDFCLLSMEEEDVSLRATAADCSASSCQAGTAGSCCGQSNRGGCTSPQSSTEHSGLDTQALIRLNVGGVEYTISLATLTAVPESYFPALFGNDWEQVNTPDGAVFLDRDGEVFKYILQYLRARRGSKACSPARFS
eukprot:jgi/Astpho2/9077/Aster-02734